MSRRRSKRGTLVLAAAMVAGLALLVPPWQRTIDGVAVGGVFFAPAVPPPPPGHCKTGTTCGVAVATGWLMAELATVALILGLALAAARRR